MEEILLRQIECNRCDLLFYVCRSCYRGQRYCSDSCREVSQMQSHREAQRKYRKTRKGREAHRKAEARRRMGRSKKKEKTVDDEGTTPSLHHVNLYTSSPKQKPRCRFCGSYGVVVTHFPRRGCGSKAAKRVAAFKKDKGKADHDGTSRSFKF